MPWRPHNWASRISFSIRASILDTFKRLQEDLGITAVYISHDLSLLKHMCDRIGIMYLGELVEVGPANQIINDPQHPYTQALVSSVPIIDPDIERDRVDLVGEVPDPINAPSGCRFHPRCPKLVQPTDFEFDQEIWRKVANFRYDLLEEDLDESSSPDAIRAEYGLPSSLSDAGAETVLSEAIENVAAGNAPAAQQSLEEQFATPCETEPIETYDVGENQRAKCILHGRKEPQTIEPP